MMEKKPIKQGNTLTINKEIISCSCQTIFEEGQKVTVREVITRGAFWGKGSGVYYPEEIIGVELEERGGDWPLSMFIETQPAKNKKDENSN